ncbi:MAG: DUF4236 domain-containing protein [Bacteroidota bacterium]|nr:DUF4236 domain-containing protein [Bacteroidota bacterium]MDP4232208.1 DUF4236 domain-containing protein [Bacteroidota bacterium]MDP4243611.1 DUF4236 domain-containing protein [Bacteroidota bacterium]MDP4288736.1 DUF4236 domain-containing protein [Bacteroidota bacterium]
MAIRFRRRIKLLPGVHLNISKSGISTSVGVRGASVTLGKRGTYVNTGLPGTGISWRQKLPEHTTTGRTIEATTGAAATEHTKTHHLHWWKILLFIGTMIAAGATKNTTVIKVFWFVWFGYWVFLFLRLIVRWMQTNRQTKAT